MPRPLGLGRDLREVVGAVSRVDAEREPIGAANRVVGHGEDVEAVRPVEVDELRQRQRAVAPPRMRVELAEKGLDLPPHPRSECASRPGAWAEIWLQTGEDPVTAPSPLRTGRRR